MFLFKGCIQKGSMLIFRGVIEVMPEYGSIFFVMTLQNPRPHTHTNIRAAGNSYHLSNVQNPCYIQLYWLINRDPFNGLLESLYSWVV